MAPSVGRPGSRKMNCGVMDSMLIKVEWMGLLTGADIDGVQPRSVANDYVHAHQRRYFGALGRKL